MAADFTAKMDTSSIEAFARGFVEKYGADITMKMVESAKVMQRTLQDSTGRLLEKGTGSQLPYALIHDRGGVIKPSRAKALAIPNDDNTAFFSGFNKVLPSPSTLRSLAPEKSKVLWLDKKTGTLKDDKGQVAYFLRRSVRMPPKYYIGAAVKEALPEIHEIFDGLVEDAIEEGAK
jgi:hypothetical protein